MRSTALTATSFKDVTTFFPVYWQQTSNIFIKPDPTTGSAGTIAQVITPGAVGTTDTTWVLDEIDGPALKYAASLDAGSISSFFVRKGTSALATVTAGVTSALAAFVTAIPTWSAITATTITTTQMADALTKAQNLIDNLTSYDVESYLADDDPEMVTVTVQAASQEVARAMRELDKEQIKISEYDAETKYEVSRFKSALELANSYLQKASIYIQEGQLSQRYTEKAGYFNNLSERYSKEAHAELNNILNNSTKFISLKANIAKSRKD